MTAVAILASIGVVAWCLASLLCGLADDLAAASRRVHEDAHEPHGRGVVVSIEAWRSTHNRTSHTGRQTA